MKTAAMLLAPVAVTAQWWGNAPDCAHNCLSSAWNSAAWPAPTAFCAADAPSVGSCMTSACAATPTAVASYSSLSSSLCSEWSSCSKAGSTGVYTASAPGITPGNGPYRGGAPVWAGGVYTVTGCAWNGSPWAGGPGGWGLGGGGASPWGDWGHGWVWSTYTTTVVTTYTMATAGNADAQHTTTSVATVALAASGLVTSTHTLARAEVTNAAAPPQVDNGVRVVGALLGGVVAVAGLL